MAPAGDAPPPCPPSVRHARRALAELGRARRLLCALLHETDAAGGLGNRDEVQADVSKVLLRVLWAEDAVADLLDAPPLDPSSRVPRRLPGDPA